VPINISVEGKIRYGAEFMRKYSKKILLVLSLTFLLVVVGCGNTGKINDLTDAATKYIEQSDYDNAILVYNKILEIKELPEIRNKLDETKQLKIKKQILLIGDYREEGKLDDALELLKGVLNSEDSKELREIKNSIEIEKETLNKAKEFHEKLNQLEKYYLQESSYITPVKMSEAIKILREGIDILESVKDGNTSIDLYLKSIKNGFEYDLLKRYSESTTSDDAELTQSIGFINDEMANINKVRADLFMEVYAPKIKEINKAKIPSKYQ
jgi:hypothetical protein